MTLLKHKKKVRLLKGNWDSKEDVDKVCIEVQKT